MIQEDNYIIELLKAFILEWKADKSPSIVIDKYAVILTAYMNGRIKEAKKT